MIKVDSVVKRFGKATVLDKISFEIGDGSIYGLVGINGAGKSTLLRIITGIYKPDGGSVLFDGERIFENPRLKGKIAFVPDELYLPDGSNMRTMAKRYSVLYGGNFNYGRFEELARTFELDINKPFNTFSKGMRRQAASILALSLMTDYIFFDETFDGLDPFKRSYFKKLIAEDVRQRGATAIITSHSLKELNDICERLAVLDKGGIVFESDARELTEGGVKVQIAFSEEYGKEKFLGLDVVEFSKTGSVSTLVIRGDGEKILSRLREMSPILLEALPLNLEEIFNFELDGEGINSVLNKGLEKEGGEEK